MWYATNWPAISSYSEPQRMAHYSPRPQGNLYRQEHYQARIFRPAVKAAGLPDGTTPHDLRHHFASAMLRATGDPALVARLMGNTSAMVLKTYGHLMPGSEDRMRQAIDGIWSGGTEGTREAC